MGDPPQARGPRTGRTGRGPSGSGSGYGTVSVGARHRNVLSSSCWVAVIGLRLPVRPPCFHQAGQPPRTQRRSPSSCLGVSGHVLVGDRGQVMAMAEPCPGGAIGARMAIRHGNRLRTGRCFLVAISLLALQSSRGTTIQLLVVDPFQAAAGPAGFSRLPCIVTTLDPEGAGKAVRGREGRTSPNRGRRPE